MLALQNMHAYGTCQPDEHTCVEGHLEARIEGKKSPGRLVWEKTNKQVALKKKYTGLLCTNKRTRPSAHYAVGVLACLLACLLCQMTHFPIKCTWRIFLGEINCHCLPVTKLHCRSPQSRFDSFALQVFSECKDLGRNFQFVGRNHISLFLLCIFFLRSHQWQGKLISL